MVCSFTRPGVKEKCGMDPGERKSPKICKSAGKRAETELGVCAGEKEIRPELVCGQGKKK
jgi:hypothetical protein